MDSAWEQEKLEARKMAQNPTRQVHALLACFYSLDSKTAFGLILASIFSKYAI